MELKKQYDVAIIGGGIGGIMTAYRLTEKKPELNVVILEKGHDIEKRICPIVAKKTDKCIKCKSCAIMEGLRATCRIHLRYRLCRRRRFF